MLRKLTLAAAALVLAACSADDPALSIAFGEDAGRPPVERPDATTRADDAGETDAQTRDAGARDAAADARAPERDASTGPALEAGLDAAPDAPVSCRVVPGVQFQTQDSTIADVQGLEYRTLSAEIPGFGTVRLIIYRGAPGGFSPGAWSFACTPNAPCVLGAVYEASSGQEYGPSQGTLTVATLASPASNEMTGALRGLEFRHLVQVATDGGWFYGIDPTGACLTMPDVVFDTTAPIGKSCADQVECGTTKICSIASRTCQPSECAAPSDCAPTELCNKRTPTAGYCVRPCDMVTPCPNGLDCNDGVCKHLGTKTRGAVCSPHHDVVADCQPGLYCKPSVFPSQTTCVAACNPFAASPGCAAGERCLQAGTAAYCGPQLAAQDISLAAIDQSCTVPANKISVPCADDGSAYRGVCYQESGPGPTPTLCRRTCRPNGPACPAGQSCQIWSIGLGGVTHICK